MATKNKLIAHQVKPSNELYESIISSPDGALVVGQTGSGKTYVIANAIKRAQDSGYINDPLIPYSVFLLTPKKAITQQRRVFNKEGIQNFEVINHSALASSYGELFITWVEDRNNNGTLTHRPVWNEDTKPKIILVDECQFIKNRKSRRTRVIQAAIEQGIKVILISATPFQKACEAFITCLSTGIASNERNFDLYANGVANGDPTGNHPIAIKRIKRDLESRNAIISIKGARYPFQPIIKEIYLNLTPEKKKIYDAAWDEYLEVIRREGRRGPSGIIAVWVANNKFRECAELLKAENIAARAFQVANYEGGARQVIVAANFVATLEKVWSCLVKIHGVSENAIGVLYGGQSEKKSQEMIDGFQDGSRKYFLTTLKSGGTAISLHHEAEYPNALPRYVILGLSWSVYEMIQVLGRAQRITSASQTIQEVCAFNGTIEKEVLERLAEKFDCLRELIERKDSFIHDIFNKNVEQYIDKDEYNKKVDEETADEDDDNEEKVKTVEEIAPGLFGSEKEFGED